MPRAARRAAAEPSSTNRAVAQQRGADERALPDASERHTAAFDDRQGSAIVAQRHAGVDSLERVAGVEANHHAALEVALDGANGSADEKWPVLEATVGLSGAAGVRQP